MSTQTLRMLVIGLVIALCVMPLIYMMLEGLWGEVITAILGVAGFVLTWEITKPDEGGDDGGGEDLCG